MDPFVSVSPLPPDSPPAACLRLSALVDCGAMLDVMHLLSAIEQGDAQAAEQLLSLVYDELGKLAAQRLARPKPGQTLQPTALVHDAYGWWIRSPAAIGMAARITVRSKQSLSRCASLAAPCVEGAADVLPISRATADRPVRWAAATNPTAGEEIGLGVRRAERVFRFFR